jgi:hypothetical protein
VIDRPSFDEQAIEGLEVRVAQRDIWLEAERARVLELEAALQNLLAVALTYDLSEDHGVIVQARAALSPGEERGSGNA